MQLRFVTMLVLSGVVHAGALILGSGAYRDFFAAVQEVRHATGTLTVSIDPDSEDSASDSVPQETDTPADTYHPDPGVTAVAPERKQSSREATRRVPATPGAGPIGSPETEAHAPAPKESSVRSSARRTPRADRATPREARQSGEPSRSAPASRSASAAPRSAPDGRREKAEQEYLAQFLAELSKYKHYPRSAQSRQQQGKVVVGLMLKSDGSIHDVQIEKRSPFPALDRAALRSVRRLDRFRPFPDHLERTTWRLSVPFQYAISDQ